MALIKSKGGFDAAQAHLNKYEGSVDIYDNRRVMNMGAGDFLVVHEGLQNQPEMKVGLDDIINDLIAIRDGDSHLSDVGGGMCFASERLAKMGEKAFEEHHKEQIIK